MNKEYEDTMNGEVEGLIDNGWDFMGALAEVLNRNQNPFLN